MAPRIKKTVTDSSVFESSDTKQLRLVQAKRKMNENGKRSDENLSFLKNKKNALLNKFLTSKFRMEPNIMNRASIRNTPKQSGHFGNLGSSQTLLFPFLVCPIQKPFT